MYLKVLVGGGCQADFCIVRIQDLLKLQAVVDSEMAQTQLS